MSETKNFIDFILAAKDDNGLLKGFAVNNSTQDLKAFFEAEGFNGINEDECDKLLIAKEAFGFIEWPPPPAY
jgi:hypothetical protein